MKSLWESISMKGEIRPTAADNEISESELAELCSRKSKIDYSQALFEDLSTNVTNEQLDKDMFKG